MIINKVIRLLVVTLVPWSAYWGVATWTTSSSYQTDKRQLIMYDRPLSQETVKALLVDPDDSEFARQQRVDIASTIRDGLEYKKEKYEQAF